MTPEQKIEQLESENQALQVKLNRANSEMYRLRNEVAQLKAEQPPSPKPAKKEKLSIDERMRRAKLLVGGRG